MTQRSMLVERNNVLKTLGGRVDEKSFEMCVCL